MKHQGQTMSETMSMVGVGLAFMRCSFLLVAPVLGPGAGCELPDWGIKPSY
jgi:sorbitol-specific phosphotransferase system component IIBC